MSKIDGPELLHAVRQNLRLRDRMPQRLFRCHGETYGHFNCFATSGSYEEILSYYGLDVSGMIKFIEENQ